MVKLKDFIRYAMDAYDSPHCITLNEFKQDVNKFKRLNKILSIQDGNDTQITMMLNFILTLYNVFEHEKCTKMMFYKVEKENWYRLKTFLVFLHSMPDEIPEVGLKSSDLPICNRIAISLRKI